MKSRILTAGRNIQALRQDTRGELNPERTSIIFAIVTAAGFLVWMATNALLA